jgi:hypothetical protein
MAAIPTSTQTSLRQRLTERARERWPQLAQVQVPYRAGFAYVDGGFAIYRASHDDYQNSYLPTGFMGGTAEDALDTACGLYLGDPTAWT